METWEILISCRNRNLNRQRIAESAINNVRLNPPQYGALHCDGKLKFEEMTIVNVLRTLIIFGKTLPRGVHFLKLGAIHQARWMASKIYADKMFMFSKQLPYDQRITIKLFTMNRYLSTHQLGQKVALVLMLL